MKDTQQYNMKIILRQHVKFVLTSQPYETVFNVIMYLYVSLKFTKYWVFSWLIYHEVVMGKISTSFI